MSFAAHESVSGQITAASQNFIVSLFSFGTGGAAINNALEMLYVARLRLGLRGVKVAAVAGRRMGKHRFQCETYNDDRMFVLHIARCTVTPGGGGTTVTTVHHENIPDDAGWCLVTYRNTARYPATRVDHFGSLREAWSYLQRVEPTVPRVSLGGRPPEEPLPFDAWHAWKIVNGLKEYDYRTVYVPDGQCRQDTVVCKYSD